MQEFNFNMDWKLPNDAQNATTSDNQTKDKANNIKRTKANDDDDVDNENEESESDSENGAKTTVYTAKPINLQPGHTGFLTFATLLHKDFS